MPDTGAKSLSEVAACLRRIGRETDGAKLWFRGCGSDSYKLIPSLYRHPTRTDVAELLEIEADFLTQFRQRAVPFMESANFPLRDNWECLFLMQHYGVPTRLLDWSENAFVALWFALSSGKTSDTAVLWILNPVKWNRQVFSHQSYSGGVLSVGDPQLPGYAPYAELGQMNTAPAAIYGTHSSPRIVAQRGVFTIAGKETCELDQFASGFRDGTNCFWRVTVDPRYRVSIMDDLRRAGFAESMIFPDLEGLARELKATGGY